MSEEPCVKLVVGHREQQLLSAFGQGQSARRKGGYLSDNPHEYQSIQWEAWRAGFQERSA